ncbi:peptidoglycan DD-metalloendopeptidase family protein [Staphylococcus pseudintermedius]|nr:peptidoglycan DD-metalloendopeptidase family protein [Staphylococcus pseudintermedius]EGQ1277948.1 peptidoglycan DD-metalloendopeptidase family protein [Staphylococcus pseudintermedius]EGQ3192048.1 peptidoglycan DD-metalloendopeptidase family protein [Staphylococcus pseudintermedius]EGQ3568535.1 peptidoglycan DD-metalloendopeptidase family protein [Staphylococcus pseudintermedius]EGQ3785311.1 peptidoglycan DD-metalloendopeptidase family protein [Staphylococcus pseudintermedius]
MLTAIDYLTEKGWIISSDPRTYDNYPKNYGYRNYTENGINYDSFCGGYHRAFDLYTNATNDVPAVTSGTVVESNDYGNFGGTLVIKDANGNDWIYGHLQRGSLRFIVGDKVNQGDIVGLQGSSNYYDNPMSAHLHLQLRPKDAPKDEKSQVCSGLPMEKYDITNLNKKQDKSKNGESNMTKKRIGTWNGVPVFTDFLPIGTRRTGQRLVSGNPKFAVFHDTGNLNSTAQQNVNYYRNTYNISWDATASAHIFVDDKECIICIPVTEKAWHVLYDTPVDNNWYGDDANDIAFGLEACYFSDRNRTMKSLDNSCRIMAALCKSWEINPRTQMPGHQDIQYDKQDPGNILASLGYKRNDMSVIDNLVVKYMKGDAPKPKVADNVPKPKPGKPPRTAWAWKGVFTASKDNKEPIVVRRAFGMKAEQVDEGSWINPGEWVPFDQVIKDVENKLWWVRFKYAKKGANQKDNFFMPIGKITDKEEKLLKEKALWGKLEVK